LCVLRDRAKRLEKEEALFKEEFVKLLQESEEENEEGSSMNDDTIGGGNNATSSGVGGKNDTSKSEKRVIVNSAHDSVSAVNVEDPDAKVAKEAHDTLKGIHSKASIERVVETASNVG
jgi:hypothetical protein